MANKLTVKQEKFARLYVEIGNASEAYRQTYDAKNMCDETLWPNASRLLKNSKVAAMIEKLQNKHAKRHDVTIDSLTRELDEDRELARREGQASAAISAVNSKAKLHGLLVDRTDNKTTITISEETKAWLGLS